uniref:Cation transporter n=1 Tax=Angiostrongylus cantonensis TaxID=6313 RepID=A0A0K0DI91_ANGCA
LNTTLQQLAELLRTVELAILIVAIALSILLVGKLWHHFVDSALTMCSETKLGKRCKQNV